jgi:hypothetical protein
MMSEGTEIWNAQAEVKKLKDRVTELERIVKAAPDRHDYADGVPAKRLPHEGRVA